MTHYHNFLDTAQQIPPTIMELLAPIRTEEQLERVEEVIDLLSHTIGEDGNHPLGNFYRNLISLVVAYQEEAFHFEALSANEMIDYLLEQNNMRQADLADKLGMTQASVSRLINGHTAITVDLVNQLSTVFRVPAEVFVH